MKKNLQQTAIVNHEQKSKNKQTEDVIYRARQRLKKRSPESFLDRKRQIMPTTTATIKTRSDLMHYASNKKSSGLQSPESQHYTISSFGVKAINGAGNQNSATRLTDKNEFSAILRRRP